MLVYSPEITSRLTYILDYIFSYRLGINVTIINDITEFGNDTGLRLNYSNESIDNVFQIIPNGLLSENGIKIEKPELGISNNSIHLYPTENGNVKFDLLSACFWMLSRYEEYQNFTADAHGRFISTQSFAKKHDFITRPVVDEWIVELKTSLKAFYKDIRFKDEQYTVIPTIDIDSPWCYQQKGWIRNLGGVFRDFMRVNVAEIPERLAVLSRVKKDAHFQFEWLNNLYQQKELVPIYFMLVGEYGLFDKTISTKNKVFKRFIAKLCSENEVGLHPSYEASDNENKFTAEKQFLQQTGAKLVTKSRQHFLKFNMPEYYRMLIIQGINDDYSMGFADHVGFRAGTSKPFKFYDLKNEQATDLNVHPFSVMDVSIAQYQNKTPEQALVVLDEIINSIKNVNGNFISLWHNESLSERMEWKDWKNVYVQMLSKAIQ